MHLSKSALTALTRWIVTYYATLPPIAAEL